MRNGLFVVAALSAITGLAQAADLCAVNPYTTGEAKQGKVAFDSKCAFCHQYNMTGREPGNFERESPDIKVLTSSDVDFLDGAGGKVPPLVGKTFFAKHKDKSLADLENLPEPDELAEEIIENIEAGLNSFRAILKGLG